MIKPWGRLEIAGLTVTLSSAIFARFCNECFPTLTVEALLDEYAAEHSRAYQEGGGVMAMKYHKALLAFMTQHGFTFSDIDLFFPVGRGDYDPDQDITSKELDEVIVSAKSLSDLCDQDEVIKFFENFKKEFGSSLIHDSEDIFK